MTAHLEIFRVSYLNSFSQTEKTATHPNCIQKNTPLCPFHKDDKSVIKILLPGSRYPREAHGERAPKLWPKRFPWSHGDMERGSARGKIINIIVIVGWMLEL